jgi:hypothetical protein
MEHFMGWFFTILASIFILLGWALAISEVLAGIYLKQRKNRTFCIVIGACECLMMPFGTILGIFTLLLLTKPHIEALFERES